MAAASRMRFAVSCGRASIATWLVATSTVLALIFFAMALSRLLISGFPAMQFNSGPVMALATALLIAIALVACYLPARHASRISAVAALRSDE